MQAERAAQIATAATCVGLLIRFSPAILGVKARRIMKPAGHATRCPAMIYRRGIGGICGTRRLATAT
jgi:hypothetical protein